MVTTFCRDGKTNRAMNSNQSEEASSTVLPIRPDVTPIEGKQQFLEVVGNLYESLANDGTPPRTMIVAMVANDGEAGSRWMTIGDEAQQSLRVARALFVLTSDLHAHERAITDE